MPLRWQLFAKLIEISKNDWSYISKNTEYFYIQVKQHFNRKYPDKQYPIWFEDVFIFIMQEKIIFSSLLYYCPNLKTCGGSHSEKETINIMKHEFSD